MNEKNTTQIDLAAACGISKNFLPKIQTLNTNASFSIAILERISATWGNSLKEMFNPIEEKLIYPAV